MAKRYELRIDADEFRAMQKRATEAGIPSVAEYLRTLHRDEMRKLDDAAIVSVISRSSNPKVT